MDYIVNKEQLNRAFSKFLESRFRDIHIDNNGDLAVYIDRDKNLLALRGRSKESGTDVLFVPTWSRLVGPLSNTFGDMWVDLLLDYVKDKSQKYPISKIVIED